MTGVLVNTVTIIICSLIGVFLVKGIPERFDTIIKKAIGLSIIFMGIKGALENESILVLVLSLVLGSILGELIDIDKWMNRFGGWAESRLGFKEGNFSKGFVTASILFCTGSMAIVGAMQSGLAGNHEMLFAKSILDGSISIVFASAMGIGVVFSAIPVLVYEGLIALGAGGVSQWLTTEIITEMSAAGSLVIAAIGFNFLDVKQIKVANMIPAIFMPWLFIVIYDLLKPVIDNLN
jgi:uncharacterized membrane protein YqgA involved in biofilm formation